jgi:hypothetical protein
MKKILLMLLCLPFLSMAQQKTFVPDDGFEAQIELLGYGDGIVNNDSVLTSAIDTILSFTVGNSLGVYSLKGIEDFTALEHLVCDAISGLSIHLDNPNLLTFSMNQAQTIDSVVLNCPLLTAYSGHLSEINYINIDGCPNLESIDLSSGVDITNINLQNNPLLEDVNFEHSKIPSLDFSNLTNLRIINCLDVSNLASIDITGCSALESIDVRECNLTALDVSTNANLSHVDCSQNFIQHLDFSNNLNLSTLLCDDNPNLSSLNLNNINLNDLLSFDAIFTPNLTCIEVNDTALANYLWLGSGNTDPQHYFSLNCGLMFKCIGNACVEDAEGTYATLVECQAVCGTTAVEEEQNNKKLIKIVDLIGKESRHQSNTPLFYHYDDGTVEKKIIVE